MPAIHHKSFAIKPWWPDVRITLCNRFFSRSRNALLSLNQSIKLDCPEYTAHRPDIMSRPEKVFQYQLVFCILLRKGSICAIQERAIFLLCRTVSDSWPFCTFFLPVHSQTNVWFPKPFFIENKTYSCHLIAAARFVVRPPNSGN